MSGRYIDADKIELPIFESKADETWVKVAINATPTADVRENVRGEWIEQEDYYNHYWECSECGIGVGLDDIRNFCPNCGADMREEVKE